MALLEARHVTKVFGGGLLHKAPHGRARTISRSPSTASRRRSPPSSARAAAARRPWPACSSASRRRPTGEVLYRGKDLRSSHRRGAARHSGATCRRSSRTRSRSTTRSTRSTTSWRRRSRISTWPPSQGRGAGADRGGAAGRRPAAGGDARPLPAPAERRPAAADHGGARAAAPPAPDHRRRAGVDGRCLAAGHDPRQPAPAARRDSASRSSTSPTT